MPQAPSTSFREMPSSVASPSPNRAEEPGNGANSSFQSLLYMCEYAPSTLAGAPVIAKQLLRRYDMTRLHVLTCEHEREKSSKVVRDSYLDCDHTFVPSVVTVDIRPRRISVPLKWSVNCLRIPRILREARAIVEEKDVEAIFTIPWRTEFALAAYKLHCETGIPLYVFVTDDWEAMNPYLVPGFLTRKYNRPLLEAAEQVWVTSPQMQRTYQRRFGLDSDFLFHFVDVEEYQKAAREVRHDPHASELEMVYTGSINQMFYDTMKTVSDLLNRGLEADGRRVTLTIYGPGCPPEFLGPNVSYEGLVDLSEIPEIIGQADATFVGVTFSQKPELKELVQTSLYTKTIDYLASGRPVLVVSPPYSGEVDYFGDVTTVVHSVEEEALTEALTRMVEPAYAAKMRRKGLDLVRRNHSMESIDRLFLNEFKR